ncbi:LysR family transcriptional regulator [Bordetella petrii]|uniref:LysR family transcriptional regulator n=1 Tax=Bordetella petrii TaxID=94624 RepID=UPI001E5490F5|nr:LysR substrate-binding domain-containing protein [Bordetella petrii]MCD0502778.1 LysR substrate-binding domain-containing protein [Bordetella petrii]
MSTTLDIELLRTFHAVARLGRFRAAAAHVHKSPAAVSVHIQRLEDLAGGRLLDRDNQAVTLTPLGQRFLHRSAELLEAHDRVLEDLRGTALAGRVRLGVPDEYAEHVIRDILPAFATAWPGVTLEVTTAASRALRDQVARRRLHMAVAVQPAGSRRQNPRAVAMTIPVWVAGANQAGPLPDPLPLALHAADCPYRTAMIETLTAAGRAWRVVLSSPSSRAVEACVEAGLGLSVVDRSRVTARMRVLNGMPRLAAHEVMLLRDERAGPFPAADMLEATLRQHFRL